MKRKIYFILLVSLLVSLMFISAVRAERIIKIHVNGQPIYTDVQPQIVNGRVMVPLRAVAEALDCEVNWVDQLDRVEITAKRDLPTNTNTEINGSAYRNKLIEIRNMLVDNHNRCLLLMDGPGLNRVEFEGLDKAIQEKLKQVSNPPDNYKDAYNALIDLYMSYSDLINKVEEPHTLNRDFYNKVDACHKDFVVKDSRLSTLLDFKK